MKQINFKLNENNHNEVIFSEEKSFELVRGKDTPAWPVVNEKKISEVFDANHAKIMDAKWAHAKELLNGSLLAAKKGKILLKDGLVFDFNQYNRVHAEIGVPYYNRSTLGLIDGIENYVRQAIGETDESTMLFHAVRSILAEREKKMIDPKKMEHVREIGHENKFLNFLEKHKYNFDAAYEEWVENL